MGIIRPVLFFLLFFSLPASKTFSWNTLPGESGKVRLLVIVDDTEPLTVDYRTVGNTVRQLVLLGSLLDIGISEARESSHSKKLRETVGTFNRFDVLKAAVSGAFLQHADIFELEVTNDLTAVKGKTRLDFDALKTPDHHYVLVLNEVFAGMVSAWKLSTLSASSSIRYELYNVSEKRSMDKGSISGFHPTSHSFDEGVSDKVAFMLEYAVACGNAIGAIYGQLNKEGHLSTMATTVGLGDKIPAIGEILNRYSKTFDYTIATPKNWSVIETGTKYSTALAPKNKDKIQFGMRFDVDLLIEDLGQEGQDLETYVSLFINKLNNRGYTLDSTSSHGLKFSDDAIVLVFNRPQLAGKEILGFNRFGKEYIGIFSVILLKDHETYLAKYRQDIDQTLASLSFRIQ